MLCIGLGPGMLVGSTAFDLFPIHAICVVVPKARELKKIYDKRVWLVELFWLFWAYIWLYIILEVILISVVFEGLSFTHLSSRYPYTHMMLEIRFLHPIICFFLFAHYQNKSVL